MVRTLNTRNVQLIEKRTAMNSGSFRKGEKRPRQGKHGSPKAVLAAREAISLFTDGNAHKLQGWLDEIHHNDGARAAFECYTRLLEYSLPKQARTELTGEGGGPQEMICRWAESR